MYYTVPWGLQIFINFDSVTRLSWQNIKKLKSNYQTSQVIMLVPWQGLISSLQFVLSTLNLYISRLNRLIYFRTFATLNISMKASLSWRMKSNILSLSVVGQNFSQSLNNNLGLGEQHRDPPLNTVFWLAQTDLSSGGLKGVVNSFF